jgi:hypothetical protein
MNPSKVKLQPIWRISHESGDLLIPGWPPSGHEGWSLIHPLNRPRSSLRWAGYAVRSQNWATLMIVHVSFSFCACLCDVDIDIDRYVHCITSLRHYFPLPSVFFPPSLSPHRAASAAFGQLFYGAFTLRYAMTNGGRYWGETSGHGSYFAELRLDPVTRWFSFFFRDDQVPISASFGVQNMSKKWGRHTILERKVRLTFFEARGPP